jgi:hypothetical protein
MQNRVHLLGLCQRNAFDTLTKILFISWFFSNEVGDFSTAEVSQTAADTSLNYDDTCAAVTEPGAAFESSLDDSRNGTADVEVSGHYKHGLTLL